MKNIINAICVAAGFVCVGLGVLGVALPVIPTTPFLLAAAFFFAKGSEKFHQWFVGTNLYRKYIEQTVKKKSMGKKEKRNLLITLGVIFTLGIIFSPVFAKVIILIIAAVHFYYFIFKIQTTPDEEIALEEETAPGDAIAPENVK